MNFTPQTDAQEGRACECPHGDMVVSAGFARELERQLNTANAKIVELQDQLLNARLWLSNMASHGFNYNFKVSC